jgi:tRNA dimethylallyltransferase
MSKPQVIAIVGPTASGKSALAVELAQRLNGEVISVDSRQVYRGMDIGTGKITATEMRDVRHHLLDIADPVTDTYTATDFERDAQAAIGDILTRGKTPILCGGTLFYLDILRGKKRAAPVPPDPVLRAELEVLDTATLAERLRELDPRRAGTIDAHNPRRLVRAIEIATALGEVPPVTTTPSSYDWLILGIDIDSDALRQRISERLDERLATGLLEEVQRLHDTGVSWGRLRSFGLEYRYSAEHLQGHVSYDDMRRQLFHAICQYAKRQRTWLRRDHDIRWVTFPIKVSAIVKKLSK